MIATIKHPEIKAYINPFAPLEYQWFASFGDWDLGEPNGLGATEQEAIDDLLAWVDEDESEDSL